MPTMAGCELKRNCKQGRTQQIRESANSPHRHGALWTLAGSRILGMRNKASPLPAFSFMPSIFAAHPTQIRSINDTPSALRTSQDHEEELKDSLCLSFAPHKNRTKTDDRHW